MRASVGLIVLLMGLLGVLLAVTTGNVYQRFVLENQRAIFEDLADIKINLILSDTINKTSDLGMSIQANVELRKSFRRRDTEQVNAHLQDQFHQFIVSSSLLKLQQVYVLDGDFVVVGYADDSDGHHSISGMPCPDLIEQARGREGYGRMKILSGLCKSGQSARVAVIVPLGGLRVEGYLLLGIDPTPNLAHVEEEMGMPLKLVVGDESPAYISEEWSSLSEKDNLFYWKYVLTGMGSQPVYDFHFVADMAPLYSKLGEMREIILFIAILSTLIVVLAAVLMMQKTVLDPVFQLTRQLRRVKKDKKYLGEKVQVRGSLEMIELSERFNDMSSELHVMYKTLERMAYTDMLTRLPNRAVFYDRLGQAVHMAQRQRIPFFLMMMDLDRFKWVNDNLGHHIGDKLLKEIAMRLRRCMRKSDTVARLGGDEFATLLPGICEYDDALHLARKVVESVSQPIIIDGHDVTCGVSIGIVHCPDHGVDGDQLVQRADVAMYHAKKKRQGFMVYEAALDEHSLNHLDLEKELNAAIKGGDLEIHYQPKIDLSSGKVIDIEALIRWRHPERGDLLPDQFMPLIEQSNLIHRVTQWVCDTVVRDCALWHERDFMVGVSINLSRRNLDDMKIVELARSSLWSQGIDPGWLCLELADSILTSDSVKTLQTLKGLHELGVRLSVDDFGGGHFSLASLGSLPLEEVKIDQVFIQKIQYEHNALVMVRSMIDLAHNIGMKVVAKGVELSLTRDILVDIGCDSAQGFYFCRPCCMEEMTAWLEDNQSMVSSSVVKVLPY